LNSSPRAFTLRFPERTDDVVSLGFKSIVSGTLTTCLIGAIVEGC